MINNENKKSNLNRVILLIGMVIVMLTFVSALDGAGTIANPYNISTCMDLNETHDDLTASYALNNSFSMDDAGCNFRAGTGFASIGDITTNFTGTFDGMGYNISNVYINKQGKTFQGFFGYTSSIVVIQNLTLLNVSITGPITVGDAKGAGGLVGWHYGNISNCRVTGFVKGYNQVGGIMGHGMGSFYIDRCSTDIEVIGVYASGGGILGWAGSTTAVINNSYSTGNVTQTKSTGYYGGGLAGNFDGTIQNSYSTGNVTGNPNGGFGFGGLVGTNAYHLRIYNSFATGTLTGPSQRGGLVGRNAPAVITNSQWFNVESACCGYLGTGGSGACTAGGCNKASGEDVFQGDVYPLNTPMSIWDFFNTWEERATTYPSLTWENLGGDYDAGPNITITFPVDGSTQNVNVTSMNYTFTDLYSEVSSCWYYNGTGNTTIACGTNVTGLTTGEGSFTWGVCSNDTLGNEDCSYTTFTVDVVPPTVTIIVPATNQEFTDATDIPLNFTIVEGSLSACTYSLNGAANITLPGCISGSNLFSFNDSIEGMNEIYVYANDSGNGLGLDSVMFDINTQNNTLLIFPTEDEWEVTDSITLQGMCRFTNGTVCGSDIACRFSAYYPNNTIFLESVFGTWNAGGRYTYAIGFTNTSTTNIAGPYTSAMSCYDGFDQDAAFTWHVLSEDNQYVFLYSLLLITAILLIIFGEWKNQWPLKYMGGLLFSFVGLWLFIHGIPGQTLSYLSSGNEDAWISWVSWIIMGFGFLYFFKAVYEDALGGDQ